MTGVITHKDTAALVELLHEAFDAAGNALQGLVETFRQAVEHIRNTPLIYLGGPFFASLADEVNDLGQKISELVKVGIRSMEHRLPIVSLIEFSFAWVDKVRGPVSVMQPKVRKPQDNNLEYWQGGAASYYRNQAVAPQEKALGG